MAAIDQGVPSHTRLRWAKSKEPSILEAWLVRLGSRVQIYQIVWDGKAWVLWFVPDDRGADVASIDLDQI